MKNAIRAIQDHTIDFLENNPYLLNSYPGIIPIYQLSVDHQTIGTYITRPVVVIDHKSPGMVIDVKKLQILQHWDLL